MKKRFFGFFSFLALSTTPITFVISCSNTKTTDNTNYSIAKALISNQIEININSDIENLKINQLKGVDFQFEVIFPENLNETQKNYFDSLATKLKKTKISFNGYYIPILNKDNLSSIFFNVESEKEVVAIDISKIYHNNKPLVLNNLTQDEIIKDIEFNLNDKMSFMSELKNKLEYLLVDEYEEYSKITENPDSFSTYWTKEKLKVVAQELKVYIAKNYPYSFNTTNYDNIFVSEIQISENNNEVSVNFSISTSSFENSEIVGYNVPTIKLFI